MIQIIIFSIFVVSIFIDTFAKLIKRKNSNYVYMLGMEFLGILIGFIYILTKRNPPFIVLCFMYLISIILPIVFLILESQNIYMEELINIAKAGKNKTTLRKMLLKNIEKYPHSYMSHKKLAKLYEENNEKEKAEAEYSKLIEISPKDYESYCKLAQLYHENNKDKYGIELLQYLLNMKPDYYKASLILGNILYDNESYKEAIHVYNEALKYSPAEYELYYSLGMTYTRLNDFANARDYYEKAAKINSFKDISNLNLGQICLIFREYDEAEQYFYKSLNSEDEKIQSNAYLYLAKIYLIKNDIDKAIQYLNLAVEINPKIVKQIENDDIFSKVIARVQKGHSKEIKSKINKKEEDLIYYLGKTYNVVENLTDVMQTSYNEKEIEK